MSPLTREILFRHPIHFGAIQAGSKPSLLVTPATPEDGEPGYIDRERSHAMDDVPEALRERVLQQVAAADNGKTQAQAGHAPIGRVDRSPIERMPGDGAKGSKFWFGAFLLNAVFAGMFGAGRHAPASGDITGWAGGSPSPDHALQSAFCPGGARNACLGDGNGLAQP